MILNLNDPLFLNRTSYEKYGLLQNDWINIWRHYKLLGYNLEELVEYTKVICKKELTPKQLSRELYKYQICLEAERLIKKGEKTIHITYFTVPPSFIKDYYLGLFDTKDE